MNKRAQILLEESQGMHGLGQPDYGSAGETYLPSEPAAPPVVRYPVSVPIYKRGKIVGAAPYYPPSGATARVTAKPVTRVVQARALPYADAIASAQQDYTKTLQALKRVMQRVSVEEQQAGVAPGSWVETDPGVIAAMQKWQETQNGLANLRMWQQERISQEQQVPRVSPAPGLEVSVMEKPVLEHVDEALSFDVMPSVTSAMTARQIEEAEFAPESEMPSGFVPFWSHRYEGFPLVSDVFASEEKETQDMAAETMEAVQHQEMLEAATRRAEESELAQRQQEKLAAALQRAPGEAASEAFIVSGKPPLSAEQKNIVILNRYSELMQLPYDKRRAELMRDWATTWGGAMLLAAKLTGMEPYEKTLLDERVQTLEKAAPGSAHILASEAEAAAVAAVIRKEDAEVAAFAAAEKAANTLVRQIIFEKGTIWLEKKFIQTGQSLVKKGQQLYETVVALPEQAVAQAVTEIENKKLKQPVLSDDEWKAWVAAKNAMGDDLKKAGLWRALVTAGDINKGAIEKINTTLRERYGFELPKNFKLPPEFAQLMLQAASASNRAQGSYGSYQERTAAALDAIQLNNAALDTLSEMVRTTAGSVKQYLAKTFDFLKF